MQKFLHFLTMLVLWMSYSAWSGEIIPYSKDGFVKSQKSGEKIVLQYHASWCPVCKKQRNALNSLTNDPEFKNVKFIAADYDTEKDLKKKYGVKGQSTVILFQGASELERSQGVTDESELKNFIQKLAKKS